MTGSARSLVDELVQAAIAGDRASFDALFDVGFAALWRAAQRHGHPEAEAAAARALRRAVEERLKLARDAATGGNRETPERADRLPNG